MSEPFSLSVWIDCLPAAQPRAKATKRGGFVTMYTPQTVGKGIEKKPHPAVEFRHAVRAAVQDALPDAFNVLECPLRVSVQFWFPRTDSQTKKTKPNPVLWKAAKPDRDNLDKGCLDCLTSIVWRDDNQVVDGRISKLIVAPGQRAGVWIEIEELSQCASLAHPLERACQPV